MKSTLESLISAALQTLIEQQVLPTDIAPDIQLTRSKDPAHGDFSSNIALMLAKPAKSSPRDLAAKLTELLASAEEVDKIEIAGPGFINIFVAAENTSSLIKSILDQGADYGCSNVGDGKKVQVEFVSANPTGPLHVGHGRGAAIGDSLCRLLRATGFDVTAEFYYNDAAPK